MGVEGFSGDAILRQFFGGKKLSPSPPDSSPDLATDTLDLSKRCEVTDPLGVSDLRPVTHPVTIRAARGIYEVEFLLPDRR
ncbi:hypothetical protein PS862_05058 [Pseudomonas fluorescens]|uniref:Uncharacterized protein n=1 Tax=Pseudomonas fluorescens TaxID=294 RepID=A0A5E7P3V8_PSEFL|nr:hypothetical protein PS862_05058 [Pseudomonas fluorescens]